MYYLVDGIKLRPGHAPEELIASAAKKLGLRESAVKSFKIVRRSIDARDRENVRIVYSLRAECDIKTRRCPEYEPKPSRIKDLIGRKAGKDIKVAVVGAGPAGLIAALTLCEGGLRPVVIERGGTVKKRSEAVGRFRAEGVLDPENNVQYGMGGAGLFSDGKLNTGISKEFIPAFFGELVAMGAPEDILYEAKPHVGTDVLRPVMENIAERLVSLGAEIKTDTRLDDITVKDGKLTELMLSDGERLPVDAAVMGIGHSAFDTFEMLAARGVAMEPKAFSVGVRIEHPQAMINEARYGKFAPLLPPADYKFSAATRDLRGVYTFCMCPGGEVVVSSSDPGTVVTNGMSYRSRSGSNANAAILVSVTPSDFNGDLFGGFSFREKIERAAFHAGGGGYKAPAEYFGELIGKRPENRVAPSALPGIRETDLYSVLPRFILDGVIDGVNAFDRYIPGFSSPGAVLIAAETRSSCPVRILRGETGESNISGLYPVGEGAGWAGGITSSAADGIKTALKIIDRTCV